MVDETLTGLGIGAIALFILKQTIQLLPQLKSLLLSGNARMEQSAGERPTEFWQAEMRRAAADAIAPVVREQNQILERLITAEDKQTEALNGLTGELREYIAMERGRAEERITRRRHS